jgi:serine/threonine protein kinase
MKGTGKQSEETYSERIGELLTLARMGKIELLDKELDHLLADPYAPSEHQSEIDSLYEQYKGTKGPYTDSPDSLACSELLRKAFGFFLFASVAEEAANATDAEEKKIKAKANKYLQNPETVAFIYKKYKVPEEWQEPADWEHPTLYLHKSGTTSYILKFKHSKNSEDYVLKIIKYYHLDNLAIAKSTKAYKSIFYRPGMDHAPTVQISSEGFIIMQFIDGKSLREYMQEDLWGDPRERVNKIKKIVSDLCSILKEYAELKDHNGKGLHHLDLSPENILVKKGNLIEIVLIDFGFNYLLDKKVGSPFRARTYIAPELNRASIQTIKKLAEENKILADVYSLGVIFLEMLSEQSEAAEGGIETFDKNNAMELLRRKYTGLGEILEDLTDPHPNTRALYFRSDEDIYTQINLHIDIELEVYKTVYLKQSNKKAWIIHLLGFALGPLDVAKKQAEEYISIIENSQEFSGYEAKYRAKCKLLNKPEVESEGLKFIRDKIERAKKVTFWSPICNALNLAMLTLTIYMIYKFASEGTFFKDLPRLMVGFSFSILATRYYINIFSSLSTAKVQRQLEELQLIKHNYGIKLSDEVEEGFRSKLASNTERSFRLNSCYFAALITICYLVNRELWPLLTAFACMFTVVNNYLSYKFAVEAKKTIKKELDMEKIPQSFLEELKGWYKVFFIYACGPLVVGTLMYAGRRVSWIPEQLKLKDEMVYAFVIFICNIIMFRYNCAGDNANRVRVELEKAINGYSKALKYVEYKIKHKNTFEQSTQDSAMNMAPPINNIIKEAERI